MQKKLEDLVDSLQKELTRTRGVSKNVDLLQKELLKTRSISRNFVFHRKSYGRVMSLKMRLRSVNNATCGDKFIH